MREGAPRDEAGALGREGHCARPVEAPRNAGGAGPGGAGLGGAAHTRERVGTGSGRSEGISGVTRQTMSRWRWVVLGSWALKNRS